VLAEQEQLSEARVNKCKSYHRWPAVIKKSMPRMTAFWWQGDEACGDIARLNFSAEGE
jgi:hypothetical protein